MPGLALWNAVHLEMLEKAGFTLQWVAMKKFMLIGLHI